MLEAVRALCAERGVAAELAMEAPMACGFGACFGCAVPLADGGYMRLCVDGPVVDAADGSRRRWSPGPGTDGPERRALRARASRTRSSTAPAPSTRSPPGAPSATRCSTSFPFAAFVSKTITPEPRAGNPPPRLWETPAGLINSIGLPEQGARGLPRRTTCRELAELPVPLIVSVMGVEPRRVRARWSRRSAARDEVAALELNVSCPNVKSGLIVGEQPGETARAAASAAAADREAADREADAERRRPGGGRARRPRRAAPTRSR